MHFAEYSNIQQNISKYRATYRWLFVNDKKEKKSFSREASKYHEEIPLYPRKMFKYLQEYLILPRCFEFVLQITIQNTSISHAKGKTEHLILSVCPDFVLSRTPQFSRQKHTSEQLFYRTAPSGCLKMSVIFHKIHRKTSASESLF